MITSSLAPTSNQPPRAANAAGPGHPGEAEAEGTLHFSARFRWMIAVPPLLLAVGAASMWHFVWFAFTANPLLNGMILAFLAWGSWTMFGHVARVYREQQVFRSGMAWLRQGTASGEQDPRMGGNAYVVGMFERLSKLGLGHQVYVHSKAMEPELDALAHYFQKKQELSQFLVSLMVALGLLGTFVGLLETLVQTSELIGGIGKSLDSGSGAGQGFAAIVGGLQGPLRAMGTAFSASMFGLVGSIMLGFQMVVVRKAASAFVEQVRDEVLSLAEASKTNANVEITERFLATLLADILQQHKETTAGLAAAAAQMQWLVPEVKGAVAATEALAANVRAQELVLDRAVQTVGGVAQVLPVLGDLADTSRELFAHASRAGERMDRMLDHLPVQEAIMNKVDAALAKVGRLADEVEALGQTAAALKATVREQGVIVRRMDTTLWHAERHALLGAVARARAGTDRQGLGGTVKDEA